MNCTNPNILLFSEKELFYVGPKGKSRQKVVTQIPEAMELLKHYHSTGMGGHSIYIYLCVYKIYTDKPNTQDTI